MCGHGPSGKGLAQVVSQAPLFWIMALLGHAAESTHLLHQIARLTRMLCSSAGICGFSVFGSDVFQLVFPSFWEALLPGFAQLLCKQMLVRLVLGLLWKVAQPPHLLHEALCFLRMLCSSASNCGHSVFGSEVIQLVFESF